MTKNQTLTYFCVASIIFALIIITAAVLIPGNGAASDTGGTSDTAGNNIDSSTNTNTTASANTTGPEDPGTDSEPADTGTATEPPTSPPDTTPEDPIEVKVENGETALTLDADEKRTLTLTVTPAATDMTKLSVRSSDESVAKAALSADTLTVTATGDGTCSVDVLIDGTSSALTLSVTVKERATTPLPNVVQNDDIDPSRPMLALTFDDGPGNYTDELLDILKKYNARATFFVQGVMFKKHEDVLKRTIAEGHEIGIHTWDHAQLTKLTRPEIREEIVSVREYLKKNMDYTPRLMRPPYGSTNDDVIAVCKEEGFIIVRWNIDTLDWKTKDPDATYKAIMDTAKSGNIILCHDIHPETIAAMERTIANLIDKGYQLVTVSEMLSYRDPQPVAGDVIKKK